MNRLWSSLISQTGGSLLLFAVLTGFSASAQGHPHVWVDMKVTPHFDEAGQLTGFHQSWQFDTFYSVVLIEEMDAGDEEAKARLIEDIVANLSKHDFYTRVRVNGERLSLSDVGDHRLEADGRRVEFSFFLPLDEVVTAERLHASGFSYQVFEPTYYMEMLHDEAEGIVLNHGDLDCDYSIETPEPTAEQLRRASEVDLDGVPEDPTLGQHFAETVSIQCR
ncbi:MAG: DUF1007 family protein [Natronospirillum sp.]|uniref:DUF1007 family protein n=1 Tax=Natronospirillum sp. TaxID=2812955 RepID=UPI0025F6CC35|nr:DUF1007 family protein [Natronospirillum sp.]MCH8551241.1 DUF1007 family protein [Natronospirillum sp.]